MKAGERVGRKAFCPCGSGRLYKNCCRAKDREESKSKRFLFYFPMIHGDGSMSHEASPNEVRCWKDIRTALKHVPVPNKVYCDSDAEKSRTDPEGVLCNTTGKICPADWDPMNKTLFWMGQRDPKPIQVSCESPELMEEFRQFVKAMETKNGNDTWSFEESCRFRDITKRRDIHIAHRINETLKKTGEVGVLFLGASHNEENHLVNLLESMGIEVKVIEVSLLATE